MKNISLIGLGKLGLPLATNFAKNNINVLAIDKNNNLIEKLKNSELPWYEPNLDKNLKLSEKNIKYSDNYNEIYTTDATIILVNTPSNKDDGSFSNEYILESLTKISKELKKCNKKNHLFILSSTVMPGSIQEEFIPLIENITNWKLNIDFGFCYVPDFVALGQVIYDFENPDLLLIGESNDYYGQLTKELYFKIIKNTPSTINTNLIEAEISKVSLNAFITMKISFANFIGNIANKFNCNPNNITKVLGSDKRISPYYIKSGVSFGGTCFPRDTWAFIKMSENVGLDAIHIKATQKINELQNQYLIDEVSKYKNKKIGLLGISFKPNTPVITDSIGNILYEFLKQNNYSVFGCDELVNTDFNYDNIEKFIDNSDVVVLLHNNKKILTEISDQLKSKIVIDPWNNL